MLFIPEAQLQPFQPKHKFCHDVRERTKITHETFVSSLCLVVCFQFHLFLLPAEWDLSEKFVNRHTRRAGLRKGTFYK